MITNGEGTMNWNCEVCGTDFIVPTNAMNTLMIAATHCATCTKELSARFSAIVGA
jgi:transcription elongation factor Elf1